MAYQFDRVSIADLADACGCSTRTIRRWINAGSLPAPVQMAGINGGATQRFWLRSQLDAWFEQRAQTCAQ